MTFAMNGLAPWHMLPLKPCVSSSSTIHLHQIIHTINTPAKKRKKKDDTERRVRAEDLEKKEYNDDVKPFYSEEELEEIEAMEQEEEDNSWINDDDIDFDEYDEYYEQEN